MAQSNDAIDRLSNLGLGRKVPVPPRETPISLASPEVDPIIEESSINKANETLLPTMIRSTVRIEEAVDEGLKVLCRRHKVTRETFLEAAYQVCLRDERINKTIMREAQHRLEKRREESDIRKLQNLNDKMKQRQKRR